MSDRDPRIDAYLAKAAPFARPILRRLRRLVHRGCPQVEETIKWGTPHFLHHGMLCGMAAFKQHCAFGFWRTRDLAALDARYAMLERKGMGDFGCLRSARDLPTDTKLVALVRAAAALNESGLRARRAKREARPAPRLPADLKAGLAADPKARAAFAAFPPGARREYCEWLTEAKQPATRVRRLATAVGWIRAGKRRNWRYARR